MRPNIEEIRERNDDGYPFLDADEDVPVLLAYIDELENMPLVQTVVKLQEENERLMQALKIIKYLVTNHKELRPLIAEHNIWNDIEQITHQVLEGANS